VQRWQRTKAAVAPLMAKRHASGLGKPTCVKSGWAATQRHRRTRRNAVAQR